MPHQATRTVAFDVDNLDCENEANAIRRGLAGSPGLVEVTVYPKSAKVSIAYAAVTTVPAQFAERLRSLGYPPRKHPREQRLPKPWENAKVIKSAVSGLLLFLGWLASRAPATAVASLPLYVVAILVGGYFFGREAIEELGIEREIGIELLMSVAAVVAAILGQPAEGATLVFLYSISEAPEGYTEEKTRSAIKALMALAPKVALVRREGREIEIPVEELRVGDVFIARPGELMATDGEILNGASSVNEAPVTGESVPVEKGPGECSPARSMARRRSRSGQPGRTPTTRWPAFSDLRHGARGRKWSRSSKARAPNTWTCAAVSGSVRSSRYR